MNKNTHENEEQIITIRSFESIWGNECYLTLNAIYNATK